MYRCSRGLHEYVSDMGTGSNLGIAVRMSVLRPAGGIATGRDLYDDAGGADAYPDAPSFPACAKFALSLYEMNED